MTRKYIAVSHNFIVLIFKKAQHTLSRGTVVDCKTILKFIHR